MRKLHKIIGGMLIAGALLTGIGSGVAFAEYSSFEYGGEVSPEGCEAVTRTLEYKVPVEENNGKPVLNVAIPYHCEQVVDADVPKDTVRFVIQYWLEDDDVTPHIVEEDDDGLSIYVNCDFYYDNVRDMMKAKDTFLKALRQHKIVKIKGEKVEKVEIHMNPEAEFSIAGTMDF
ncbi:MAG: hypothetical protein IJ801_06140 [Lachnospiraceae bacterium]|nr:hypothetical protein [Lachnospiraceae bacterium]